MGEATSLRRFTVIRFEQAAELRCVADLSDWTLLVVDSWFFWIDLKVKCAIVLALVGTMAVVELGISLHDVIQVPQAEAEEVVQAFAFDRGYPGFDICIAIRCSYGCVDDIDIAGLKDVIKSIAKLFVAIMDQMRGFDAHISQPHQNVPSLLLHPILVGVVSGG